MKKERLKYKLLEVLTKHIGSNNAIGMAELYEKVFNKQCKDLVNDTRVIRKMVTTLRREGVPICSSTSHEDGGYYLASAGAELEDYCKRLRIRALKILSVEATLRNLTLPELLGQLTLNLGKGGENIWKQQDYKD